MYKFGFELNKLLSFGEELDLNFDDPANSMHKLCVLLHESMNANV